MIARIPSAGMRRGAIGAFFAESAAREAAPHVDALLRRVMAGDLDAHTVVVDLASWLVAARAPSSLADDPTRPRRVRAVESVRAAAEEQGLAAVAAILAEGPSPRALPKHGRLAEVCQDVEAPIGMVPWCPIFVGQNMRLLERLRVHHDPRMIRRVLGLRGLRTSDVALIAARRPTSAEIARAVALSPRWMASPEVRAALALNPFTPIDVAAPLLPALEASSLRLVACSGLFADGVEAAARALLALRASRSSSL